MGANTETAYTDQIGEWVAVLEATQKRDPHPYRNKKYGEIAAFLRRSRGEAILVRREDLAAHIAAYPADNPEYEGSPVDWVWDWLVPADGLPRLPLPTFQS